ncbi:hypothetical protein HYH03_008526 [Edaphochlamys debaryana]|uniref:Uncharacterized protein n=1 Tax=Edaphochlamys debaryana TaxID=47281 RepID=A0A835Y002_9CHLO|nr:hypothetical protein HYH03_008526 [Edaphochlamys debaryana]|eukprot:KAG2493398.1 hypothetical protein HYH03_008526 [Edaphochlamys debaryana]
MLGASAGAGGLEVQVGCTESFLTAFRNALTTRSNISSTILANITCVAKPTPSLARRLHHQGDAEAPARFAVQSRQLQQASPAGCDAPSLTLGASLAVPLNDTHDSAYYQQQVSLAINAWSAEATAAASGSSAAGTTQPLQLCPVTNASVTTTTQVRVLFEVPLSSSGAASLALACDSGDAGATLAALGFASGGSAAVFACSVRGTTATQQSGTGGSTGAPTEPARLATADSEGSAPSPPNAAGAGPSSSSGGSSSTTGAIVGAVIGALAGVAILAVIALVVVKRRQKRQREFQAGSAPEPGWGAPAEPAPAAAAASAGLAMRPPSAAGSSGSCRQSPSAVRAAAPSPTEPSARAATAPEVAEFPSAFADPTFHAVANPAFEDGAGGGDDAAAGPTPAAAEGTSRRALSGGGGGAGSTSGPASAAAPAAFGAAPTSLESRGSGDAGAGQQSAWAALGSPHSVPCPKPPTADGARPSRRPMWGPSRPGSAAGSALASPSSGPRSGHLGPEVSSRNAMYAGRPSSGGGQRSEAGLEDTAEPGSWGRHGPPNPSQLSGLDSPMLSVPPLAAAAGAASASAAAADASSRPASRQASRPLMLASPGARSGAFDSAPPAMRSAASVGEEPASATGAAAAAAPFGRGSAGRPESPLRSGTGAGSAGGSPRLGGSPLSSIRSLFSKTPARVSGSGQPPFSALDDEGEGGNGSPSAATAAAKKRHRLRVMATAAQHPAAGPAAEELEAEGAGGAGEGELPTVASAPVHTAAWAPPQPPKRMRGLTTLRVSGDTPREEEGGAEHSTVDAIGDDEGLTSPEDGAAARSRALPPSDAMGQPTPLTPSGLVPGSSNPTPRGARAHSGAGWLGGAEPSSASAASQRPQSPWGRAQVPSSPGPDDASLLSPATKPGALPGVTSMARVPGRAVPEARRLEPNLSVTAPKSGTN